MSNENGKTHFTCNAHELLTDHIQEFNDFKGKMERSMEQTSATFHAVASIHQDTYHLRQLPTIATKLDLQTTSLIDAMKQNGSNMFMLLCGVMALVVIVVAILLLKDSNKDFSLGRDGFHMTQKEALKP